MASSLSNGLRYVNFDETIVHQTEMLQKKIDVEKVKMIFFKFQRSRLH